MKYRLGLDLGPTSLGWAVLLLDNQELPQPKAIIKIGSRIFSDGRDPKTSASLAVDRRQARQARRRRDRLLKRKKRLIQALIDLGFFPITKAKRKQLVIKNPYALRAKGLDEVLTPEEFGRAIFHLNQRRGFKSNRKTDGKDAESGAMKTAINKMYADLEAEGCRTVGEWLNKRRLAGKPTRARLFGSAQKDRRYAFYVDRALVEQEFDALFDQQQELDTTFYTDEKRKVLKDILLFQRNLRPVKPGRCTLLPDEPRAPLALPSQQQFRLYQELNNLRIENADHTSVSLNLEQRDTLAELLNAKTKLTFKTMRRVIKLPANATFNLEDIKRADLQGNKTAAILSHKGLLGKAWFDLSLAQQDKLVGYLLNEESETKLLQELINKWDCSPEQAELIMGKSLPEGYGRLSKKALDSILSKLKADVITFNQAVEQAEFDSHSALSHFEQTGEIMSELPYYGIPLQRHVAFALDNPQNEEQRYGKIANPTVHIGLNQIRTVFNAIIKRYGHPHQVVVEVARELKQSKKQRDDLQRDQAIKQKRNKAYVQEACQVLGLNPDTIDRSKRRELSQKMQLWVELNPKDPSDRRCPFSGGMISIEKLLSAEIEIEHILPFSMTLDDSMANKTVSFRHCNREKSNQTPFQAFSKDEDRYFAILTRTVNMQKNKAFRFKPDGYQQWLRDHNNFIARALNDSRYLSRLAREYVSNICPGNQVWVVPGSMTGILRRHLGVNHLLSGDDQLKTRDDHRHHALDAVIIGISDRAMLKRFSDANVRAKNKGIKSLAESLEAPWPTFKQQLARALVNIKVSHRPDHSYQGAFFEETAWGIDDDGLAHRRVREGFEGSREKKTAPSKSMVQLASGDNSARHGQDTEGKTKKYKAYIGGSNYCMEIYENDKGKWRGEVVSRYEAYQVIRQYGEAEGWKRLRNPKFCQNGMPLVMRLMINDVVRMQPNDDYDLPTLFRVVKMSSSNGQMFFCELHQANVDKRNRDKSDPFAYVTKLAGSMQKAGAQWISLSPLGEVRTKS